MSLGNSSGDVSPKQFGKSGVKRSFAQRADINDIVARYRRTGVLDYTSRVQGVFADVSGMGDFRTACDKVVRLREAFESLPAIVRTRFNNDPANMVEFLRNTENREEAIKLGLVKKPEAPATPAAAAPDPAGPVAPTTEGAKA